MSWLTGLWRSGWVAHAARTGVAATASFMIARLLRMPEAYWAAVSTLVVMQSTLGAAWAVSIRRLAGTALGAVFGGLLAGVPLARPLVLGLGVFALGPIGAVLRLDSSAYRFAGITFAIVVLVTRGQAPATVATHRFVEVSTGIGVALALTALWPGRDPSALGRGK